MVADDKAKGERQAKRNDETKNARKTKVARTNLSRTRNCSIAFTSAGHVR